MARDSALTGRSGQRCAPAPGFGAYMREFWHARSTLAFLFCVPLIAIIGGLVVYPFFYSIYLSTLNKAETEFVGFGNFLFLFDRSTFWMVVRQSILFTVVRGAVQGLDRVRLRPPDPQRLGARAAGLARPDADPVGDPAGAQHARLVVAVRPDPFRRQLAPGEPGRTAHPVALGDLLGALRGDPGQHLVRRAVLHDHVPGGAEVDPGGAL